MVNDRFNGIELIFGFYKDNKIFKLVPLRHAAVDALDQLPIEQLIEGYWTTKDQLLPRFIASKLPLASLVFCQEHVTLYQAESQQTTWPRHDQVITCQELQYLEALLKYEQSPLKQELAYQADQRPEDYEQLLE